MKSRQPGVDKRHHSSHWGAFRSEVLEGRLVGVSAFEHDPDPSPILDSIPDALYSEARTKRPMVRQGWLENGPGGNRDKRGGEPFVPVPENPHAPHPIVRLQDDLDVNRRLWEVGLEGMSWYHSVLRAKAGATVLLRHPIDENMDQ